MDAFGCWIEDSSGDGVVVVESIRPNGGVKGAGQCRYGGSHSEVGSATACGSGVQQTCAAALLLDGCCSFFAPLALSCASHAAARPPSFAARRPLSCAADGQRHLLGPPPPSSSSPSSSSSLSSPSSPSSPLPVFSTRPMLSTLGPVPCRHQRQPASTSVNQRHPASTCVSSRCSTAQRLHLFPPRCRTCGLSLSLSRVRTTRRPAPFQPTSQHRAEYHRAANTPLLHDARLHARIIQLG